MSSAKNDSLEEPLGFVAVTKTRQKKVVSSNQILSWRVSSMKNQLHARLASNLINVIHSNLSYFH